MTNAALLYPVFVQVALTLLLMIAMGGLRRNAVLNRQVKLKDIALGQTDPWPERPKAIARAFHNQLETPMLFYAVVAFALVTKAVTIGMVAAAWAYVALRLVHAAVHTGSNNVQVRFTVFLASVAVLLGMWLMLAIHVAQTGG